jgi:hypothetical protein
MMLLVFCCEARQITKIKRGRFQEGSKPKVKKVLSESIEEGTQRTEEEQGKPTSTEGFEGAGKDSG